MILMLFGKALDVLMEAIAKSGHSEKARIRQDCVFSCGRSRGFLGQDYFMDLGEFCSARISRKF